MAGSKPSAPATTLRRYRAVPWLVLVWAVALVYDRWSFAVWVSWEDVVLRVLSGFPSLSITVLHAGVALFRALDEGAVPILFLGTLALPLGFLARMVARARMRAGHADPLEPARRWVAAHPRIASALAAVLPAAYQAMVLLHWRFMWAHQIGWLLVTASLAGWVQARFVRSGLRVFLEPTVDDRSAVAEIETVDPDEIRFDAVAVTTETRAAVAALGAVTLVAIVWIMTSPIAALFTDSDVLSAIAAYVAVAAASAWIFQRASRIAVGKDGVYVGGSSRPRFFAFRDLDEAREGHGDLELVKRGATALRLQLHGQDVLRRGAILARVRDGIAEAQRVQREGATHFVASVSSSTVARSSQGATDYRVPSISRDSLWSLVEGAGVEATARTAAALAIVEACDGGELRRLRVAASRCADPGVRASLVEIAADREEAEEEEADSKRGPDARAAAPATRSMAAAPPPRR
jgi:hypothetical protein